MYTFVFFLCELPVLEVVVKTEVLDVIVSLSIENFNLVKSARNKLNIHKYYTQTMK